MQKRNLVIVFLIITNLFCIFIIIKQNIAQKSAIQTNLRFDQGAERPFDQMQIDLLKKELFNLYDPSAKTCGAAVRLSERAQFAGTARFDMACLIQGNRKIVWETLQKLKNEYDSEFRTFQNLIKSENIQEIEDASYRPEGKRDAFLFVKESLEDQKKERGNPYLAGSLLGYDKNDIEFFYQRLPFSLWLRERKKVSENFWAPFSYAEFSTELKKQFEQYEKQEWPKDNTQYELDKKQALEWLNENNHFTDEQLHQQIQELKRKEKAE